MGGLGSVLGRGSVALSFLCRAANKANWLLRDVLGWSDEEDTLASLPPSDRTDLATDGAAVLRRVEGGMEGASWLEGPVVGDNVNEAVVLDIVTAARCCCGAASSLKDSHERGRQQRNLW